MEFAGWMIQFFDLKREQMMESVDLMELDERMIELLDLMMQQMIGFLDLMDFVDWYWQQHHLRSEAYVD